jgi:hypothetical protein
LSSLTAHLRAKGNQFAADPCWTAALVTAVKVTEDSRGTGKNQVAKDGRRQPDLNRITGVKRWTVPTVPLYVTVRAERG